MVRKGRMQNCDFAVDFSKNINSLKMSWNSLHFFPKETRNEINLWKKASAPIKLTFSLNFKRFVSAPNFERKLYPIYKLRHFTCISNTIFTYLEVFDVQSNRLSAKHACKILILNWNFPKGGRKFLEIFLIISKCLEFHFTFFTMARECKMLVEKLARSFSSNKTDFIAQF